MDNFDLILAINSQTINVEKDETKNNKIILYTTTTTPFCSVSVRFGPILASFGVGPFRSISVISRTDKMCVPYQSVMVRTLHFRL